MILLVQFAKVVMFLKKTSLISELKQNDLVVILSTGAYGSCMASSYNLRKMQKKF